MIIYLHGLNSSSHSNKAMLLRTALASETFFAPDYPAHRPDKAVAQLTVLLSELSRRGPPPVLVGSSMGGFYGQYLARQQPVAHLFMINPALRPWQLLSGYADTPMVTASGETYRLSAEIIESTRAYGIDNPCDGHDDGMPTTLFLDQGDEVIDYRVAQDIYRRCGRVLVYAGGNHAFAHMPQAIDLIRTTLRGGDGSPAGGEEATAV